MNILQLDHLVLTVSDIDRSLEFYTRVLGMEQLVFGEQRVALGFGQQKINLHQQGREPQPNAEHPLPGSADLCFITDTPLPHAMDWVHAQGVEILEGPVQRTGAVAPLLSFYFRDPDGNLIEISNPVIRHNSDTNTD